MISFDFERDLHKKNIIMIGVDEAGRGSWAGPLVSTACWFDFAKYKYLHSEINDSKKLKSSKRREIILSLDNFVKYSSSIASVKEIDQYGLSYANAVAMKRSIFSLTQILKRNSQSSFYSNQCYDTVGTIIYFSVALFKNCILSTNNALARYIIVE